MQQITLFIFSNESQLKLQKQQQTIQLNSVKVNREAHLSEEDTTIAL